MLDQGENEGDMLLTEMRNAELPYFEIKQLRSPKFQDAGKPNSLRDNLVIDLTQDLLGASTTGYVIRTTFADREGASYSCALKRINTTDEKPPDLARLWHPHVVHLIHHWSEKSGLHDKIRGWMPKATFMTFLVMELMDGDLAKLMTWTKKAGVAPFSLRVAVDVMLQIAKGMLYLHDMGVSHPHLKGDNVLCKAENKTEAYRVGDVLVKLGGFGCSMTANVDTKNRDVFCFGLTCLEILTGDEWSEDIYGADRVSRSIIPETTPPILKHCIASCLDSEVTFSEVVMLLLLAQCQIMQTCEDRMILSSENLHIRNAQNENQDLASLSRSNDGLQEMFHVHQLHPELGDSGLTSFQITLIFFHGFPKVPEEWRMTWMTRDNMLVWPQKWLPEDLDGDIRILSVSFHDHLNVSSNRIQLEIVKNLLQRLVLSARWKLGESEPAIILVGHSFGGVIIKTLVNEAQSLARKAIQSNIDFQEVMKCKKFLKSLASVVFYSVSHAPTSMEFENYISGCSNTRVLQRSSLLKSLRGDANFVPEIRLSRDFESAVPHKTKVLAFVEGKPMRKKCFLVTEKSCEGQSLSWEWYKVDKDNHFEVCRPDSKNHTGYKILLRHLQQLMITPCDFTFPTINMRRQSWKVIGTVLVIICKFKKLLDRRNKGNILELKPSPLKVCDPQLRAGDVKKLIDLDLNRIDKLKEFPKNIGDLGSLQCLNLSKCRGLIKLPHSIGDLRFLRHLNLSGCYQLIELPKSIGNLRSLQYLNLSLCFVLEELPPSIGNLVSLQYLNLDWSTLRCLPQSIGNLVSLQHLHLSRCNELKELPKSIGELKSLQHLDLKKCLALKKLLHSIGDLKSLQHLILRKCFAFKVLPKTFGRLKSLDHLNLSRCYELKALPKSIGDLVSLQHLNLSECSTLEELPDAIGGLRSLQYLNLSKCYEIEELPENIGTLLSLQHLNLSECSALVELPENIGGLRSLQHLNLSGCYDLKRLPKSIGDLGCLQHLDLRKCFALKEPIDDLGFLSNLSKCGILKELPILETNSNVVEEFQGSKVLKEFQISNVLGRFQSSNYFLI